MLSNLIDVRAAADWRVEGSLAALDAYRPGAAGATLLRVADICGTGALAIPRPRAAQGTLMPGMRQALSQASVFGEQDTRKKYQHATRVAANGGSTTGSHPASWDPV